MVATTETSMDVKMTLMLETLKALARESSPDALTLAVYSAAHETGITRAEALRLLAPLFETQKGGLMYRLFWSKP
jgi:hypothetical protein